MAERDCLQSTSHLCWLAKSALQLECARVAGPSFAKVYKIVHLKMKIMSLFTHPYVISKLYLHIIFCGVQNRHLLCNSSYYSSPAVNSIERTISNKSSPSDMCNVPIFLKSNYSCYSLKVVLAMSTKLVRALGK